jgi:hypothetical protein
MDGLLVAVAHILKQLVEEGQKVFTWDVGVLTPMTLAALQMKWTQES